MKSVQVKFNLHAPKGRQIIIAGHFNTCEIVDSKFYDATTHTKL